MPEAMSELEKMEGVHEISIYFLDGNILVNKFDWHGSLFRGCRE